MPESDEPPADLTESMSHNFPIRQVIPIHAVPVAAPRRRWHADPGIRFQFQPLILRGEGGYPSQNFLLLLLLSGVVIKIRIIQIDDFTFCRPGRRAVPIPPRLIRTGRTGIIARTRPRRGIRGSFVRRRILRT
jgi:hypothetical protein